MAHWISTFGLLIPLLAMGAGCMSLGAKESQALPRANNDQYSLLTERAQSDAGCVFDYRVYEPLQPSTISTIVLGHGFLRDQDNLIGLSREMANRGIRVVTLDFCNMRPWNGNHVHNAADMRKLVQLLALDNVIYGGFSAGALAAILAADHDTVAILALDLVDQDNLGAQAIKKLSTPLIGLHGPASSCNAYNNGQTVFEERVAHFPAKGASTSTLINGASHCEFESPSNWLCELACGDADDAADAFDDSQTRETVIQQTIAAITPFLITP